MSIRGLLIRWWTFFLGRWWMGLDGFGRECEFDGRMSSRTVGLVGLRWKCESALRERERDGKIVEVGGIRG